MQDIDEAVHALCQELSLTALNSTDDEGEQEEIISAAERRASSINNEGRAAQERFLAEHGGW